MYCGKTPGGPLAFDVRYHLVIRIVFQDQAMYARASFRGEKTCKIGKKGCVLVIVTNFGKDLDKLRKKNMQKFVFRVYFIPEKYVFRVCLKVLLQG